MQTDEYLTVHLPGTSANNQQLFGNHPNADVSLIYNKTGTEFALHSKLIRQHSGYFQDNKNEKQLRVSEQFKEEHLSKILSLFYGFTIKINRSDINSYFSIVSFLKLYPVVDLLKTDMETNLAEYDLFVVLRLAHKNNIDSLLEACFRQLLNQEFQQINYNIFDLLGCPQDVFRLVISHHNKMRASNKTTGLSWQKIQEVVKQYCDTNSLPTNKAKRLLHELVDHKELFQQETKRKIEDQAGRGGSGKCLPQHAPSQQILCSRQMQIQQKTLASGKMIESMINAGSQSGLGGNTDINHMGGFPSTPPVRGSTFYSHIFKEGTHNDAELDQSAYPLKATAYTSGKMGYGTKPCESANKSHENPFKSKKSPMTLEVKEGNERKHDLSSDNISSDYTVNVNTRSANKIAAQPLNSQYKEVYSPMPNFKNKGVKIENKQLNVEKKTLFDKEAPQSKNQLLLPLKNAASQRKLSQHIPKTFSYASTGVKSALDNLVVPKDRSFNDSTRGKSPYSPRQPIKERNTDSPLGLGDKNGQNQRNKKLESNTHFNHPIDIFPKVSQTPPGVSKYSSQPKDQGSLTDRHRSSIVERVSIDNQTTVNNNNISLSLEDNPTVKKAGISKPKQSLDELVKKSRRMQSYEIMGMEIDQMPEINFQEKKSSNLSQNELLKEIDFLNQQATIDQRVNKEIQQQIRKAKIDFANKEGQRKQQKNILIGIQSMLSRLQKQFQRGEKDIENIDQKIDELFKRIRIKTSSSKAMGRFQF